MRQLTKELKDIDVLFFEMPKDAADYYLDEDFGDLVFNKGYIHVELWRPHKIKDYEIIGEYPLTEEQAAKVVENDGYDFEHGGNVFDTSLQTLESLIKSVGILTANPIKEPDIITYYNPQIKSDYNPMGYSGELKISDYRKDLALWQEAQANVWQKILIVIRKKK